MLPGLPYHQSQYELRFDSINGANLARKGMDMYLQLSSTLRPRNL
jgi:hypothetical protein